jgi:hypothetical protein
VFSSSTEKPVVADGSVVAVSGTIDRPSVVVGFFVFFRQYKWRTKKYGQIASCAPLKETAICRILLPLATRRLVDFYIFLFFFCQIDFLSISYKEYMRIRLRRKTLQKI